MTELILCHCVSGDCRKCPMRITGTSGIRAEMEFFHRSCIINDNKEDKSDEQR